MARKKPEQSPDTSKQTPPDTQAKEQNPDPRDADFGKNANEGVDGKDIYSEEFNQPGGEQVAGYDPGHQYPNVVDTQAGEKYDTPAPESSPESAPESSPESSESSEEQSPDTDTEGRKISLIVLHCSDSDNPKHDNVETIRQWHTEEGFVGPDGVEGTHDDIGYHYIITKDGKVHEGRPVSKVGAHVKGHNKESVGICLTGKLQSQFTKKQFLSAKKLIQKLFKDHKLDWKAVRLHNQLDKGKTCPNFRIEEVISA